MKKIKIGIIGCGAIGSALAKFVSRQLASRAYVAFFSELHPDKARSLIRAVAGRAAWVPLGRLIRNSDLVIECASAQAASGVTPEALRQHKQILVLSAGGLILDSKWRRALKGSRGKLWVPSGAVCGLDALVASREAGIKSVKVITRKSPRGLIGAPYFQKNRFPTLKGSAARCVFRGTARQAVRAFPQNVNVAAVLSLAGVGPVKTRVEVWTSKAWRRNSHEIRIESRDGSVRIETHNLPSRQNPKTSALAVSSAKAVLRNIFSNVRIGT